MALTRRQREVLNVIEEFITRNSYSPSLEEIGSALGLSSVATVHKHVTHLVEKGLVRRVWNQNRSIEIVPSTEQHAVALPLVGTLGAGRPIEEAPTTETVLVPADMVAGRAKTFALRVHGDSMNDEQIRHGDVVIVEDGKTASEGETVVAVVDGSGATVRRWRTGGGDTVERLELQGVIVGVIRRY